MTTFRIPWWHFILIPVIVCVAFKALYDHLTYTITADQFINIWLYCAAGVFIMLLSVIRVEKQ